jgi:DNA-binding response OmpR family regulator
MHALIIEQDTWIVFMIEDVLRELGYNSFAVASSRDAAVAAANHRCPDLITSDIRLGASSGVEAVRQICSDKSVPVVFVTATPWEIRESDSRAVVVPKPFAPATLKDGISRAAAILGEPGP